MIHRNVSVKGFTIIELMLAMSFLTVLLLAIALLIMQISSIYNKGLTVRAVNEAGQLITADIQRTLNTSKVEVVQFMEGNENFNPAEDPQGGRLCADDTVYAWNYGGDALKQGLYNKFETAPGPGPIRQMRMVKFQSSAGKDSAGKPYCSSEVPITDLPKIPLAAADLLDGADVELAVYDFTMAFGSITDGGVTVQTTGLPVTDDSTQRIYPMSLRIGTGETSIIDAANGGCEAPSSRTDDEYCAVNQFTFTARSGNKEERSNE